MVMSNATIYYIVAAVVGSLVAGCCCMGLVFLRRQDKPFNQEGKLSWYASPGAAAGDVSDAESIASNGERRSKSKKKSSRKLKKKRKDKKKKRDTSLDSRSSRSSNRGRDSEAGFESGPEVGSRTIRSRSSKSHHSDTDLSPSESETPSQAGISDQALMHTFRAVLSEGLVMKLHSASRAREVTLWLQDADTLCWRPTKSLSRKGYQLNLNEVLFVEVGKQTPVLRTGSGVSVSDDLCLSLITPNMSVDFEASSKVEREAMAQGFSMLIGDLKAKETKDV